MNCFVGDKLEQGKFTLDRKKILDLKNIEKPMLLFASRGDNIAPPQQALDWIIKEYSSAEQIKRRGKLIIYMLHPRIGHLGIFVGSKVAREEHNEIIKNVEIIVDLLNSYQGIRDKLEESSFFVWYESPLMKLLFPGPPRRTLRSRESRQERGERRNA